MRKHADKCWQDYDWFMKKLVDTHTISYFGTVKHSIALKKCWTQAPVKTLDLLNDARNNASCSQLITTRYNSPANLHLSASICPPPVDRLFSMHQQIWTQTALLDSWRKLTETNVQNHHESSASFSRRDYVAELNMKCVEMPLLGLEAFNRFQLPLRLALCYSLYFFVFLCISLYVFIFFAFLRSWKLPTAPWSAKGFHTVEQWARVLDGECDWTFGDLEK